MPSRADDGSASQQRFQRLVRRLVVAWLALGPTIALAEQPVPVPREAASDADAEQVHVDLALSLQLPIMLGGQATLELPYGFLVQGELGVLPQFSVNAIDSGLSGAGVYDEATSELVREGLGDSLIVRLSAGFRPFPDYGFEFFGGYTLASLGGGISARTAVEAATGTALPTAIPDSELQIDSTLHNVHVALGWRWVIADYFMVRASLGYVQTVASSSQIELPAELENNAVASAGLTMVNAALNEKLDEIYSSYVKLPTVGLAAGARF